MPVSGLPGSPPVGSTTPPPSSGRGLDRNAFLRLLVAQLSNQDPTSPQSGHEFAAQLAQFSSVEQLSAISDTLAGHSRQLAALGASVDASAAQQGALGDLLANRMDLASASGLIGRTVEAAGNRLAWGGAEPAPFGFSLAEPAASVRVEVRDASGAVVRVIDLGHQGAGAGHAAWDGLGEDGQPLPPGTYTFAVDARTPTGEAIPATTAVRGRVDRITIEPDGIRLWIGGLAVPLNDLRGLVP